MKFRVVGRNTSNGDLTMWHFATLENADAFAHQTCKDSGQDYDVVQLIGTWRRSTEYVSTFGKADALVEAE